MLHHTKIKIQVLSERNHHEIVNSMLKVSFFPTDVEGGHVDQGLIV